MSSYLYEYVVTSVSGTQIIINLGYGINVIIDLKNDKYKPNLTWDPENKFERQDRQMLP